MGRRKSSLGNLIQNARELETTNEVAEELTPDAPAIAEDASGSLGEENDAFQSQDSSLIDLDAVYFPEQSRKYFDPDQIAKHKKSMLETNRFPGRIAVRLLSEEKKSELNLDDKYLYELVYGETRCKAAQELDWGKAPADILDVTDKQARRIHLEENLNRQDLSALEEVEGLLGEMAAQIEDWQGGTFSVKDTLTILDRVKYFNSKGEEIGSDIAPKVEIIEKVLSDFGKGSLLGFRGKARKILKAKDSLAEISSVPVLKLFSESDWNKLVEISSVDDAYKGALLAWILKDNPTIGQIRERKKAIKSGTYIASDDVQSLQQESTLAESSEEVEEEPLQISIVRRVKRFQNKRLQETLGNKKVQSRLKKIQKLLDEIDSMVDS
ncbi:MAG: ParB N-terminal domain-containing protein [Cyanobacteria bacterium P01_F01_bin.150]